MTARPVVKTALIALGLATFALPACLLFPIFAQAKMVGKPTVYQRRADNLLFNAREQSYIDPIYEAISHRDLTRFDVAWKRFQASSSYSEDATLRVRAAKFLLSKGSVAEAHTFVNQTMFAADGTANLRWARADAMSLWLATASGEPTAKVALVKAGLVGQTSLRLKYAD